MANRIAAVILSLIAIANSQHPGTNTPEVHPKLTSQRCTRAKGCVKANTSIVLDSNFRWNHNKDNTNCINTTFNSTICPDAETCAKNCALEGVEYSGYGLKTSGDSVSMNLFTKKAGATSLASPRVYLFDEDSGHYSDFRLLNQEFAFDVDMSKTGCGVNGALYFSEMNLTGDKNELNTAGAKYGTGYCDAQCPKQNFIHGKVRHPRLP
jgi:cellulose 1,4-beta-cellobiosidase